MDRIQTGVMAAITGCPLALSAKSRQLFARLSLPGVRLRVFMAVVVTGLLVPLLLYGNSLAGILFRPLTLPSGNRLASIRRHLQGLAPLGPSTNLPPCPLLPPHLEGPVKVSKILPTYRDIEERNPKLRPGGRFWPEECQARHRVAIIIPYRDRHAHLKVFLNNIHPFLQKQQLDYGIFVIELVSDVKFNRAMLFNIGATEALKRYNYSCFIFHDVDLIPEDDRNLYTCPELPRHMSVAIDKLKYRLPYWGLFGGVSAMSKDHFFKVNGFSNKYFGWGGEDDDMYTRIRGENLSITRYSADIARYKMLSHAKESPNPKRHKLLHDGQKRVKVDGLSSLQYTVVRVELRKLYTWILVDIDEKAIMGSEKSNGKTSNGKAKTSSKSQKQKSSKDH